MMRRTIRAALCLLALCGGLSAQTIVKSSGASNIGNLGDVTLASKTDGDGLRVNADGDFVNTALFDPTTTDLLAARMAANWGAAGTSACATTDGIMYDNDTVVGCNPNFRLINDTQLYLGVSDPSSTYKIVFGTSGNRVSIFGDVDALKFQTLNGTVTPLTLGGAQTALFKDTTTTTGVTTVNTDAGAGQGATVLAAWRDNAGTTTYASVGATGLVTVTGLDHRDGGTRPTCDASTRGTSWFDEGGAGVADSFAICAKDAADAYDWRTIY